MGNIVGTIINISDYLKPEKISICIDVDSNRKNIFNLEENHICLFDYLFISSQMSAKPYFIGSTGILLLW